MLHVACPRDLLLGLYYSLYAWAQFGGGHGGRVSSTFLDGGDIICYVPPHFCRRQEAVLLSRLSFRMYGQYCKTVFNHW